MGHADAQVRNKRKFKKKENKKFPYRRGGKNRVLQVEMNKK